MLALLQEAGPQRHLECGFLDSDGRALEAARTPADVLSRERETRQRSSTKLSPWPARPVSSELLTHGTGFRSHRRRLRLGKPVPTFFPRGLSLRLRNRPRLLVCVTSQNYAKPPGNSRTHFI